MNRSVGRWCLAAAVGLVGGAHTSGLRAEDTERCATAYEHAQEDRQRQRFFSAREQLALCLLECPTVLARDCSDWLRDLEARMPTLEIVVRDERGATVTPSAVSVDGRALAGDELTVELDPGEHRVEVRGKSGFVEQVTLTLRPGDRIRHVTTVRPPPPAATPPAKPAAPPTREAPEGRGRLPLGPGLLGAFALAALGVGGTLDLSGFVEGQHRRQTCKPDCTDEDVDAIERRLLVGDLFLGTGAAALGVATVWWVARPPAAHRRTSVRAVASRQGIGVGLAGAF
ncbi:MAG: hypothetical protein JW751_22000 [Polyangiaceae bacterium]|nr:hypothetical protein [Polyangiaceae bacterium]